MARTAKKNVYERIEKIKSEIALTKEHLVQLESQLEELKKEKDNLEMEQTWELIKDKGLTIEEVKDLLNNIIK